MVRTVSRWVMPVFLTGLWLLFSCMALSQTPDASVGAALRNLATRADVVFAGRVTAIRRGAETGGGAGVVSIDFGVEQALAGSVGATYTLREWGGLWAAGQHRYWVGERVVMFLHGASAAGLSSPVDGMEGVLPVVQVNALSEPLLDLRRVAARVLRAQGAPVADAVDSAMTLSQLRAVVQTARLPVRPKPWPEPLPEPARIPLPPGIVQPPVVVRGPIAQISADASRAKLDALLQPVDPERKAVGESVWATR